MQPGPAQPLVGLQINRYGLCCHAHSIHGLIIASSFRLPSFPPTRCPWSLVLGPWSLVLGVRSQESGVRSQESGVRARTPTGFYISARGWNIGTTPGSHAKKIPALERPERLSKLPPKGQTKHPATPKRPRRGKRGQESGTKHNEPSTRHGTPRHPCLRSFRGLLSLLALRSFSEVGGEVGSEVGSEVGRRRPRPQPPNKSCIALGKPIGWNP
jgi:hypothetical protein